MKKHVKLLTLLLCLVLAVSALPLAAMAEEIPDPAPKPTAKVTCRAVYYKDVNQSVVLNTVDTTFEIKEKTTVDGAAVFGAFPKYGNVMYEHVATLYGENLDPASAATFYVEVHFVPHYHDYRIGYNRQNHWEACRCGSTLMFEKHVDPAKDDDSICTCGYKFSDNANLVTLYLTDMQLAPRFTPEVSEYIGNVFTYKPVTSTEVKYRTFDALATVDAPTTVDIQEGMNVIEVTVTAEDRKTTKTYTVFATLGSKADGIVVSSIATTDGLRETVLEPQAKMHRSTASLTLSKAVGEKMALQAENNESTRVVLEPGYSKWSILTVEVTMPGSALEALSQTKADLVIKTFSGNIVIPNAEMASLAKEGETLVFTLAKADKQSDAILTITADGKEVKNAKVSLEAAEK